MCEIFALSASEEIEINPWLKTFFRMPTNIRMAGVWLI